MSKRTYKRLTGTIRSTFFPLGIIFVLLIATSLQRISYFKEFYLTEKTQEATLLAQTYVNTLESILDAKSLLTEQFYSTLEVAGNITSRLETSFSNEMLADLAKVLNVDTLHVYDNTLKMQFSSENLFPENIAQQGHPVRDFYDSGLNHSVDEIRLKVGTDTYYLYSYQRLPEGGMIQSGIRANKLAELSVKLNEQWIIDKITKDNPLTQITFINPRDVITASSNPEEIGQQLEASTIREAIEKGPTLLNFRDNKLEWYLKFYIPIKIKEINAGTLILLFDLTNTYRLYIRIASTTIVVLIILFFLFSFTIIHIARKNKRIFTVAYYDETTGLPNTKFLKEVLEGQDHRTLALFIISPLRFHFINLIYGYNYSGRLLQEIAQFLNAISYKGTSMQAFRFKDDRFILTVKNYGSVIALQAICNQILAIGEQMGNLASIDLCIGIVERQEEEKIDFDTMIKEASIALNAADKTNRVQFYTKELGVNLLRQDTIENELKKVIAGEKNLLYLAYQPIVNAKNGFIISLEALARLHCETLGNVSSLEFIAIAEKRHLIIPLGKIILQQAASFLRRLTEQGFESISIGVNVSALQLLDVRFIKTLQEIAQHSGIKLQQLGIELTESVFTQNFEFLSQQVQNIHSLGIRIAIDDFGTGFSSLSRLEDLNVDVLKIDKQFVDRLTDSMNIGLSSDIISMGHHLGMQVIAEGVETDNQRQQLLEMGCDALQGYLFSRPVGEEEILKLLENQVSNWQPHHVQ